MHIRGAHGCTWSPQNLEKQPNRHYEIKKVLNVKPVYEEKTFKYRKESMALDVHKLVGKLYLLTFITKTSFQSIT